MNRTVKDLEGFEKRLADAEKNFRRTRRKNWLQQLFYWFALMLHRIFEVILALLIIPLIIPGWCYMILRRLVKGHAVWEKIEIYRGDSSRKVNLYRFASGIRFIRNLPLFLYVISGRINLIGISLKNYQVKERVLGDAFLFRNKPGVINLWFIRSSSRTDYEGRLQTEYEYLHNSYPLKDLLLILYFIPALFYHHKQIEYLDKIVIFDVDIDNVDMSQTLQILEDTISENKRKRVYFVNPDCLNKALVNDRYRTILQQESDLVLADGIGIVIASKIMNTPLQQNVNGTDLLPFLCKSAAEKGYRIYLLGAKPGIAETMKRKLESIYEGLQIVGLMHGYFNRATESARVVDDITKSGANILLVAFGAPWQEEWIADYYNQLTHVNLLIGVGGLFDFYSDTKRRAPRWMRQIGLEWVFRLLLEPKRMWKRYILGNPHFLAQVVKYMYMKKNR